MTCRMSLFAEGHPRRWEGLSFALVGFNFISMSDIRVGLIGGSGLGQALGAESGIRHEDIETPFGRPSDAIVEAQWAGVTVLMLSRHGPGHVLNPTQVPFRANIF